MITILSTVDQNPRNWEISYEPIVELHIMGASTSSMWDGPVSDDEGKRGLELIGTNCVHTGVVRCNKSNKCRLDEIPLDAVMSVSLDHDEVEKVTLRELEIGSSQGPVATLSWLLQTLKKEGNGEEGVIRDGAHILCSTPGALHQVLPGTDGDSHILRPGDLLLCPGASNLSYENYATIPSAVIFSIWLTVTPNSFNTSVVCSPWSGLGREGSRRSPPNLAGDLITRILPIMG